MVLFFYHTRVPVFLLTIKVFLDDAGSVKLGDFGLSKVLTEGGFANSYAGVRVHLPAHPPFTKISFLDRVHIICPRNSSSTRRITLNPIFGLLDA